MVTLGIIGFTMTEKKYEGRRPTHVDYEVKLGDFFLVNFSSENPEYNRISYDDKLFFQDTSLVKQIYVRRPGTLVISAKKEE